MKDKNECPDALAILGRAYVLNGEFDKAKEIIAGFKDNANAETCYLEGWLLFKEGKMDEALNR